MIDSILFKEDLPAIHSLHTGFFSSPHETLIKKILKIFNFF